MTRLRKYNFEQERKKENDWPTFVVVTIIVAAVIFILGFLVGKYL